MGEVEGVHTGGEVHILELGERVEGDARWQMPCPRTEGTQTLTLRLGFRGRRAVSRGGLAGRTFEWWVEQLKAPLEPRLNGAPLWVGCELRMVGGLVSRGACVVGRLAGKQSTPAALWTALSKACGSQARVSNPLAWCGLLHPSVQGLLDAAAAPAPHLSLCSLGEQAAAIGSRSSGLSGLTGNGSQLRLIGQLAGDAFVLAMEAISPTEPKLVFEQLLKRKEFQLSWLPEELRKGLSKVCAAPPRPPPYPATRPPLLADTAPAPPTRRSSPADAPLQPRRRATPAPPTRRSSPADAPWPPSSTPSPTTRPTCSCSPTTRVQAT
jgi:hypothetical protein